MLRRLYDWTMNLAKHPKAVWALGGISFAESSFFPIPPDVVLVPMVIANPAKARWYAFWCTITSVLGGVLGYAIGYLLYDTVGLWIINLYGLEDKIDLFRSEFSKWGAWLILLKGLTPIPYKLVTILSGFAAYDIWMFIILSFITRGVRFFIVAELLRHFGEPIREFIEKRLVFVTMAMAAIIIGGFLVVPYLV